MPTQQVFGTVFPLESVIAAVVFAAILLALLFAVLCRRAGARAVRRGGASQRLERRRLESYYVAGLAVVAAFLVVHTAWQNHREHETPARRPVRVKVTAFQWCWRFDHLKAHRPVSVRADCRGGKLPTLVVPAGRPVRIELTSRDVIHSLWVPALRYKMDAFPHHVNTFTIQVDHAGRWIGRCAEFCGDRHTTMDFWLRAVSPAAYKKWLAQQADAQPAGAAA